MWPQVVTPAYHVDWLSEVCVCVVCVVVNNWVNETGGYLMFMCCSCQQLVCGGGCSVI